MIFPGPSENASGDESLRAAEDRIRSAYERRKENGLYSWFNPGHLLMMQERERRFLRLLPRCGCDRLHDKQILEIGCGTGHWLREFIKWGARPEYLTGIDLLPDRISEAKRLCPEGVRILSGNAARLEFPDASFDLLLQSTVFTSILDDGMRQKAASEMMRVTRRGGLILWYDYFVNNPRNPDVRAVKKREIHRLFPGCDIRLTRLTLAPPLARALARRSWLLCRALESIPLLCTHYLGVMRRI